MKGIHYVTDDNNKRIAVQIDLQKYGELWEDFYDVIVAEKRKNEESVTWDEVKNLLNDDGE